MNPVPRFDPDDPYPESDGVPMAENTLQFDLGIRFALRAKTLEISDPDGQPFLGPVELARRAREAKAQAQESKAQASVSSSPRSLSVDP